MTKTIKLQCSCGETQLEVSGDPIMVTECLCNSCRAAAARLERLKGARKILNEYGATRFGEYRKDRVHFIAGQECLREFRLKPDADTRRVVACCCNTPVFMEMKGGHWVSVYGQLWPEGQMLPLDMRTMTSDLPDTSILPNDVPNLKRQSLSFYTKLFGAWVAMKFKNPKIEVKGELNA